MSRNDSDAIGLRNVCKYAFALNFLSIRSKKVDLRMIKLLYMPDYKVLKLCLWQYSLHSIAKTAKMVCISIYHCIIWCNSCSNICDIVFDEFYFLFNFNNTYTCVFNLIIYFLRSLNVL